MKHWHSQRSEVDIFLSGDISQFFLENSVASHDPNSVFRVSHWSHPSYVSPQGNVHQGPGQMSTTAESLL